MRKVTLIEKKICELTFGGVPTDIDWFRKSKLFISNYKKITGLDYNEESEDKLHEIITNFSRNIKQVLYNIDILNID